MYGFVNSLQIANMKYTLRLEYIVYIDIQLPYFNDIKSVFVERLLDLVMILLYQYPVSHE